MPVKKINLTSEVKARLRQAILGELNPSSASSTKVESLFKMPKKKQDVITPAIKFAPKVLKKISSVQPVSATKPSVKPLMLDFTPNKAIGGSPIKSILNKPDNKYMAIKSKTAKTAKKLPAKKIILKKLAPAENPAPAIMPKSQPSVYRPFASARRDWEKPHKEESLEKLFGGNKNSNVADKAGSFWGKTATEKPAKQNKHLWLKLIGVVVLFLALVVGFIVLGIYKYGLNNPLSNQAAQYLNLPAGYAGDISIGVAEYFNSYEQLAQPLALNREGLTDYSGKSDLSDRIFYRLAANKLIENKLKMYNKAITAQDLDNQVSMLLTQTGGQEQADKVISSLYSLKFDQFRQLVLLPMMERTSLQTAIINDEALSITQTAKNRANEILAQALASSTDFNELAKQYSDDESSVNTGGDLGWVVKGQLDQAWENSIFSVPAGTVVDQPIKSGFGYHIVKVEQKLFDKATGVESVKLRHILIKVDVDKYIKELLESVKIVKFIN